MIVQHLNPLHSSPASAVAQLSLVRSMRALGVFALVLTLTGCVSREVVYQRSLAAPHPRLPRSDFEQIAELLSHRTRESITEIRVDPQGDVMVHTAFPGADRPGRGTDFSMAKRNGRWHVVEGRELVIQ